MTDEELYEHLSAAARATWQEIRSQAGDSEAAFEPVTVDGKRPASSPTFAIDLMADRLLGGTVTEAISEARYVSEERPWKAEDLTDANHVVVADPLDGTQLLFMGSDHWTVSAGLVHVRERRLIAAATIDSRGQNWGCLVNDGRFKPRDQTLHRPRLSGTIRLTGSKIAFDGRKPAKMRLVQAMLGDAFDLPEWVLGYGGSPAILKVISGHLDAVFGRCRGYDFAPSAMAAQAAGATVIGWDGHPIRYFDSLVDPENKHTWIVAATPELAAKLQQILFPHD